MVLTLAALLVGQIALKGFGESEHRFELNIADISGNPRKAPKHGWQFTHRIEVLGRPAVGTAAKPLFKIYAPNREISEGMGLKTGRMLVRLWDFSQSKLRLKHPVAFGEGCIDVYLCEGGSAGGEQLLGREVVSGRVRNFNAIFIYQVGSLTDAVEAAREVAHEYGHAILPAVGGFVKPEDWGNGYLGERLFLEHLRIEMQSGRLASEDIMGADAKSVAEFCRREIDPSVAQVVKAGPNFAGLRLKGPKALEAYLGLKMYLWKLLDDETFARVLVLAGSRAAELPDGIAEALKVGGSASLRMPSGYTQVWVPLPKGWRTSGAAIIRRKDEWALIQPKLASVRIGK